MLEVVNHSSMIFGWNEPDTTCGAIVHFRMLKMVSKRFVGAASREARARALQILPRFYLEMVVDNYDNPRNVGSFDKNDPTIGTGLVGAPASGYGHRKQMEGVSSIKIMDIEMTPMSFHPLKLQRFMLAVDAIKAGVKSYDAKRTLATASEATSGETTTSPVMAAGNRLRPISPHLSIYKPQSSSMTSIFNRISGSVLAAMILGFYILYMKMPLICYSYAEFYQFFHFSANFSTICAQIAAVAMSYHLYDGIKRLAH